jgi:hypothetical protein
MRRRALALLLLLPLGLIAGCDSEPAPTGGVGVAVDSAGRLVAVLALCPQHQIDWLEVKDESTGTRTTITPSDPSTVGTVVILTGPIAGDPRPEGALDVIDRSHDYTLSGGTVNVQDPKKVGNLLQVRFKLDTVLKTAKLRQGSVLAWAPKATEPAVQAKKEFTDRTLERCD